jgi:hypothetical protein
VTKGGDIAGPKILEHVVDVVLYMEVCSLTTLVGTEFLGSILQYLILRV